jgi:hypothetical protein
MNDVKRARRGMILKCRFFHVLLFSILHIQKFAAGGLSRWTRVNELLMVFSEHA